MRLTKMAPLRGTNQLRLQATRAASSIADLLSRIGLGRVTRRARLLLARITGDRLSVEVHGVTVSGTYSRHYQYLLQLPAGGPHPYQLELFVDRVEPDATILDVGAHIGVYATLAAQRVGSAGRVIAVEPDARNVEILRANLVANAVEERVEIIEAAASDANGTVRFYLDEAETTGTMGSQWEDPLADSRPAEIPAVRLDDVLGESEPDLVKIDVQGAEVAALRGLQGTFERYPPKVIFVELNRAALERAGSSGDELVASVRNLGLEVWFIDEARREPILIEGAPPSSMVTENLLCTRA